MNSIIIQRPDLSLTDAGKLQSSRSFHIGNLSLRDLLPIIAGGIGETFDLNKISDKAYQPTKLVYQKQIYDLFHELPADEILATKLPPPTHIPPGLNGLSKTMEAAIEQSANLSGFWMNINNSTGVGTFTTLSEKISSKVSILKPLLQKITEYYVEKEPAKLLSLRGRYIDETGNTITATSLDKGYITYTNGNGKTVSISLDEIVSRALTFLQNVADLSMSRGHIYSLTQTRKQMEGPIFSNELTGLCSYVADCLDNPGNEQIHLGGQAMYNYVQNNTFKQSLKEFIDIVTDNKLVSDDILLNGFGVVPVQFYRFIGYEEDLLEKIERVFTLDSEIKNSIYLRSEAFRQYQDAKHPEVINASRNVQQLQQMKKMLLAEISNHEAISSMPEQTKRDGTLNQLYHSQFDLIEQISYGFSPKDKRSFLMNKSAQDIQAILNQPLQKMF